MELGYLAIFYLIGSIPVAWLVAKLAGDEDIRDQGSGNAGVMNVAIHVARWAGIIVLLAEISQRGAHRAAGAAMGVERLDGRSGGGGCGGGHALVDLALWGWRARQYPGGRRAAGAGLAGGDHLAGGVDCCPPADPQLVLGDALPGCCPCR